MIPSSSESIFLVICGCLLFTTHTNSYVPWDLNTHTNSLTVPWNHPYDYNSYLYWHNLIKANQNYQGYSGNTDYKAREDFNSGADNGPYNYYNPNYYSGHRDYDPYHGYSTYTQPRASFDRGSFDPTTHPNWRLVGDACGESETDRIIGGTNATMGQYPWLAQIGYKKVGEPMSEVKYRCAGTLITARYVLTASHCVYHLPAQVHLAAIRLGEYNLTSYVDCHEGTCAPPVQDFYPQKIYRHSRYEPASLNNDIAIIRLNRNAQLNDFVKTICLEHGDLLRNNYVGVYAEVAGWGVTDVATHSKPEVLQFVKVPIRKTDECKYKLSSYETQICAGGISGQDSCGGDSGGPLMKPLAYDGAPKYYIIGIVSFGPAKCGVPIPALYTRVSSFLKWVLDALEP